MEKEKQTGIIGQKGVAMRTNEVESQLKEFETSQAELEDRYQCRIKRLENKAYYIDLVSKIVGKDGELELKQLILENRLPIIVGSDGEWYTEWFPEDIPSPLFDLFIYAYGATQRDGESPILPEKALRLSIFFWIGGTVRQLRRLHRQLMNQDEYSLVLERQIEVLDQLNQNLDFLSREELSELMPDLLTEFDRRYSKPSDAAKN